MGFSPYLCIVNILENLSTVVNTDKKIYSHILLFVLLVQSKYIKLRKGLVSFNCSVRPEICCYLTKIPLFLFF